MTIKVWCADRSPSRGMLRLVSDRRDRLSAVAATYDVTLPESGKRLGRHKAYALSPLSGQLLPLGFR